MDEKLVTTLEISEDSIWSLESAQQPILRSVTSMTVRKDTCIKVVEDGHAVIKRDSLWMAKLPKGNIGFSRTAQMWRIHHAAGSECFLSTNEHECIAVKETAWTLPESPIDSIRCTS
jgi:hypothetical protein